MTTKHGYLIPQIQFVFDREAELQDCSTCAHSGNGVDDAPCDTCHVVWSEGDGRGNLTRSGWEPREEDP